jgi:type I restriction enzyme R subunit
MITDINSEDRLVQQTFAVHLEKVLGWSSVYAYYAETFGPNGTLGRHEYVWQRSASGHDLAAA